MPSSETVVVLIVVLIPDFWPNNGNKSKATLSKQLVKTVHILIAWLIRYKMSIKIRTLDNSVSLARSALQWRHNESDGVSNHRRYIVYSAVGSHEDQRRHQSSAWSLAFVREYTWPVIGKMFPFDDVIMKIRTRPVFMQGMNISASENFITTITGWFSKTRNLYQLQHYEFNIGPCRSQKVLLILGPL